MGVKFSFIDYDYKNILAYNGVLLHCDYYYIILLYYCIITLYILYSAYF